MTDFRIQFSLFTHIKLQKLEKALGDSGFASLIKLWFYAASTKSSTGELSGMDTDDIETAAVWRGAPGVFVSTLLKTRLLDRDGDAYIIHDWAENNPWAAGAKVRSERARKGGFAKSDKARQTASEQQNLLVACNQHCPISDPVSISISKTDRSIPLNENSDETETAPPETLCDDGFDELVSDEELLEGYEPEEKSKAIKEIQKLGVDIPLAMSGVDKPLSAEQVFAILSGPPTTSGPIPHTLTWPRKNFAVFAAECPVYLPQALVDSVKITEEQSRLKTCFKYLTKTYRTECDKWLKTPASKKQATQHRPNNINTPQASVLGSVRSEASKKSEQQTADLLGSHKTLAIDLREIARHSASRSVVEAARAFVDAL